MMVAGDLNPRILDPLLQRLGAGDRPALDELVALVYRDLHRMAGNLLRREAATGRTRPTSLVNDLYLELQRQGAVVAGGAGHFFQIAGYLMRQILVNRARRRGSQKRGAGQEISALDGGALDQRDPWAAQPETLLALDGALEKLERLDPTKARIVELRYFGGLSVEETARALEISPATVKRHWAVARLWLFDQLEASGA
jgi:RNA polymerase sigma factor (TIGR02999 family)